MLNYLHFFVNSETILNKKEKESPTSKLKNNFFNVITQEISTSRKIQNLIKKNFNGNNLDINNQSKKTIFGNEIDLEVIKLN
jgi:hypothetical protein